MRLFATIFLLCVTLFAFGQPYPSNDGTFTVDQIKGCAPLTIQVTSPCTGADACSICYTPNSDECTAYAVGVSDVHTYDEPGTYEVRIVKGPTVDRINITVVENLQPEVIVSACENNQVFVRITDNNYDSYRLDFHDGDGEEIVLSGNTRTHNYGVTGPQTVTVRGVNENADDNCNETEVTINTVATIEAPVITRLDALDNAARIEFNGDPGILYRLEISTNGSAFQQIRTIINKTVDTVENLQPDNSYYCFRVVAFDACNNQPLPSDPVCTANVDLQTLNNENRITWSTSALGSPAFFLTATTSSGSVGYSNVSSPYKDFNIVCGTEYCYQLRASYSNALGITSESYSLIKCGTAISTDKPDPLANISAAVLNPGVTLEWMAPFSFTPAEYSIFKSVGGGVTLLSKTNSPTFTDNAYTTAAGYCYRISFVDVCGNQSDLSEEACPIRLTGSLDNDNGVNLSWNLYNGWVDGVLTQNIEKYDEAGILIETIPVGQQTSYFDANTDPERQVYQYRIVAYAIDNLIPVSISNVFAIVKDPKLFYPGAFTPNGDDLNDIFNVYGQYISQFEMDIYNRWGELLFTTDDLDEGWDGTFKNNAMPEGTYTFVAKITDLAGRQFKKSGSILLLRKK